MGRVGAMTLQKIKDSVKLGDLLADTLANLNAKVSDATLVDSPPAPRTIATGSITGDGGAGRQITVGFKCSMVVVVCYYPAEGGVMIPNKGITEDGLHIFTGCALHASDGFTIGTTASERINASGKLSYYWAISE